MIQHLKVHFIEATTLKELEILINQFIQDKNIQQISYNVSPEQHKCLAFIIYYSNE